MRVVGFRGWWPGFPDPLWELTALPRSHSWTKREERREMKGSKKGGRKERGRTPQPVKCVDAPEWHETSSVFITLAISSSRYLLLLRRLTVTWAYSTAIPRSSRVESLWHLSMHGSCRRLSVLIAGVAEDNMRAHNEHLQPRCPAVRHSRTLKDPQPA